MGASQRYLRGLYSVLCYHRLFRCLYLLRTMYASVHNALARLAVKKILVVYSRADRFRCRRQGEVPRIYRTYNFCFVCFLLRREVNNGLFLCTVQNAQSSVRQPNTIRRKSRNFFGIVRHFQGLCRIPCYINIKLLFIQFISLRNYPDGDLSNAACSNIVLSE